MLPGISIGLYEDEIGRLAAIFSQRKRFCGERLRTLGSEAMAAPAL
jgi:hypothetical protein